MDLTWTNLVHLVLFDLTLKTERKFHHLENDLVPFFKSSWDNFQLQKHFTTTEVKKRITEVKKELEKENCFLNGAEDGQGDQLWALRKLVTPQRPRYQVPDVGIMQERTVLDEVTILENKSDAIEENLVQLSEMNIEYIEYRPKVSPTKEPSQVKLKAAITTGTSGSSQVISTSCKPKFAKNITARIKALHIPPAIMAGWNIHPQATHANLNCPPLPSKEPSPQVKPLLLPYEISKMLHKKGYPKVAMKFAAIIPPKKIEVVEALQTKEAKTKIGKKKKDSKTVLAENNFHLDSLIPLQSSYLGSRNPFMLGSADVQRAARNLLCNRKLNQEDLTNKRSQLRKRKHPLCIEESRKLWKNMGEQESQQESDVHVAKMLSGRVVNHLGETRLIMSRYESQIHTLGPISS